MKIDWLLHKDNIALKCEDKAISYKNLNDLVNAFTDVFVTAGIKPGEPAGIYLPKSIDYVAVILALLNIRAIYVPLDVNSPAQRLEAIIGNSGIHKIICLNKEDVSQVFSFAQAAEVTFIQARAAAAVSKQSEPVRNTAGMEIDDEQPFAILYTSGSTGQPKGVTLTHRNLNRFLEWAVNAFHITSSDRLINHAPFHFDISLFDIFASLTAGACAIIVPYEKSSNPQYLVKLAAEEKITIWQSVASALVLMVEYGQLSRYDFSGMRHILFTGERMPVKFLNKLLAHFPAAEWYNIYGATETNDTFIYRVDKNNIPDPVPIGIPLPYVDACILDNDKKPVVPGTEGELFVSAPTTMAGYWPVSGDTNSDFFVIIDGKKYFKTRDIVHQGNDGNWHLHGRVDDIIKSGGHRVNLLEIEKHLLTHQDILEAAVIPIPDDFLGHKLVTFVCTVPGKTLSSIELRQYCSARLPRYMIPHHWFIQDYRLQKTTSGKINKTLLKQGLLNPVTEEGK